MNFPFKTNPPSSLWALCILQILEQRSGADHPLTQQEIMDAMQEEYGVTIPDRKTVSRYLSRFKEFTEIPLKEKRKKDKQGYYLSRKSAFTDDELLFFADVVLSCKHISEDRTRDLVKRIRSQGTPRLNKRTRHAEMLDKMNKAQNDEFFENIKKIDNAKAKGKQLAFRYQSYGTDKKIRSGEIHHVTPFQLFFFQQYFYLLAKSEDKGRMSLYRLDHVSSARVTDKEATELRTIEGYPSGIDYRSFAALPYPFLAKPVPIRFRITASQFDNAVMTFGLHNLTVEKKEEDSAVVKVTTVPLAMECWALQNLPFVEVLEPEDLRRKIAEGLTEGARKYTQPPRC